MTKSGTRKSHNKDLDDHLKRAFQSMTEEALPDKLALLLARLRDEDAAATGETGTAADGTKE